MQNKNHWEKIKSFLGKNFNKKRYFAVAAFVLVHGLVAILGIAGITSLVKHNQKSEVIVLPTPEPPEEIFGNGLKIGSIAENKDVQAVVNEAEEIPEQSIQEEKEELNPEEEATTVFKEETKEEFKPEFPEKTEILNDYTGEKLVKSKTMGDWRVHSGIDIKAEAKSSVYAIDDGTVEKVYDDDLFGTTVVISHAGGFTSMYKSLDKNINTAEGDLVKKGQEIAKTGDTALCEKKEAPHLHFELLKDGEQVNPKDYIKY